MNFKKYFHITLWGIVILLFVIIGTVVLVDPYQQYKKSDIFIINQRLENPGVAKHHDYNAVIVGSSMAMNHYPSQIDSLFGWNTINLTTMGGTDDDYTLLFPYITQLGKTKHLLWCVDYFSFFMPGTTFLSELYLYNDKYWDDYPYWLNYTSLKNVINKINSQESTNRDSIYHFDSPSGKEHLLKYYKRDNNDKYLGKFDFTKMEKRFKKMEEVVMPLLKDVDVYIYFPPYSILEFKIYQQYDHLEQILEFKKYMIEHFLKYPNVKMFDFQKEDFICNLDEYMDLRHHSHAYNKRIIEYINKDSFRVQKDTYKNELIKLDSLIKNYSLNE